jgi:hypothetical protein
MAQIVGWPGGGQQLTKTVFILVGEGDPSASQVEDVLRAGVGSIYLRSDGSAGSTFFVRESAAADGWAAK